jgi:DNA-binding transcriptional ArsR family regulator
MAKDSSYTTKEEQLARIAKAMGHPARIAILNFLAQRDSCYFGAIHEELPIAKATVSQHLKELKDAGLIQGEIEAPRMKYCICRPNWKMAQVLMDEFLNQGSEQKNGCCG